MTVRAADIILDGGKLAANRSVGYLVKLDLKVPSTLLDTVEDGPEDVGEPSNLDRNKIYIYDLLVCSKVFRRNPCNPFLDPFSEPFSMSKLIHQFQLNGNAA
jgi:hypothetical protein